MRSFVSSTFKDLRPERQAAIEVLRRAEFVPWGMELFVSSPSKPLDEALRELQLSDAVLLIIGFRAGSLVPEAPSLTYTAAEFEQARKLGKPIFAFIQADGGSWQTKNLPGLSRTRWILSRRTWMRRTSPPRTSRILIVFRQRSFWQCRNGTIREGPVLAKPSRPPTNSLRHSEPRERRGYSIFSKFCVVEPPN